MSGLQVDRGITALVVDDIALNRLQLSSLLGKIGIQEIYQASGVVQALALNKEFNPSIILLDQQCVAFREISDQIRISSTDLAPILIVTSDIDKQPLELREGGEVFIGKPVDLALLHSKVQYLLGRRAWMDQIAEQNSQLQLYKNHIQEEREIARQLINRVITQDLSSDTLVRYFLESAEQFSGDLIYASRTPDGRLHVLMADSCGYGLTAALSVIPLTHPFQQMTAKGFDIQAIISELNRRVRDYLPLPRFIAAAFISLDIEQRVIRVWNGGCPPVLFITGDGTTATHTFSPKHLPLGVLAPELFNSTAEYYCYENTPGRLMLCSDGVSELKDAQGKQQGLQELLNKTRAPDREQLFNSLIETVRQELGGLQPADDLALIQIECPLPTWPEEHFDDAQFAKPLDIEFCDPDKPEASNWSFSLKIGADRLKVLDVLPFLTSTAARLEENGPNNNLFIVLSELFNNALDHGLLKLDSNIKSEEGGMERYFEERISRLAALAEGEIEIQIVKLSGACATNCRNCKECNKLLYRIHMRDTGEGFDYARVRKTMTPELQKHGRGISLLHRLCSEVKYLGNGSEVIAFIDLQNHECLRFHAETATRQIGNPHEY